MTSFIPMSVVDKVIRKRVAANFDSITHIHDSHSVCPETVDEGSMRTCGLRASRRFADPKAPGWDDEYHRIAPSDELSKSKDRATYGLTGNILIPYSFEVRYNETVSNGYVAEPGRLMYGMCKQAIECQVSGKMRFYAREFQRRQNGCSRGWSRIPRHRAIVNMKVVFHRDRDNEVMYRSSI